MNNSEQNERQSLDAYLSEHIAVIDSVKPEEVTYAYVHEQIKKRFYPKIRNLYGRNRLEETIHEIIQEILREA